MESQIDPNLFAVDWAQLSEALAAVIVLSFLVERVLSVFIENRHIHKMLKDRGIKEYFAIGLAFTICYQSDFDLLAILMHQDKISLFGLIVTSATIAGGSKASIKLFHDVMGAKPKRLTE